MSDYTLSRLAPAKLNLFLHITGRRADGYHQLQTVFQLLDYGDDLHFGIVPGGKLSLHISHASPIKSVPVEDNLVIAAAKALRKVADIPELGANIKLFKRLPMGAGLGGGSSDAAATLLALNQLWQLDFDIDALRDIGQQLGADVPVFVSGRSAWAEGTGDKLEPLDLPRHCFLVLTPEVSVSTARIFAEERLTRDSQPIKITDFMTGATRNDCQSITCKLYPEVGQALEWLSQFAEARMTGTGASVFAKFADSASAEAVLQKRPSGLVGFVAHGINSLTPDILHN